MSLLVRALMPFTRVPPSSPNCLPKALPSNTITVEIKTSICEFRRTQIFSSQHNISFIHTFFISTVSRGTRNEPVSTMPF